MRIIFLITIWIIRKTLIVLANLTSKMKSSSWYLNRILLTVIVLLNLHLAKVYSQSWRDILIQVDSLTKAGEVDSALSLGEKAWRMAELQLEPADTAIATIIERIGQIYYAKAEYFSAESLFRQALAIRESKLGQAHTEVVKSLNWLGKALTEVGEYAEAESLYQITLSLRKQLFGSQHPEVAKSLNNLGVIYRQQGRYSEAETLYQQALLILEGALGKEHPDVAKTLTNFGILYSEQGRFDQAVLLHKRALTIREKTLGPSHPDVGRSLDLLASEYSDQGKLSLAEPLFKRALEIAKETMGLTHPSLGTKLYNLGIFYMKQGKYPQAESAFQRALDIYNNSLGAQHPYTAIILLGLATVQDKKNNHLQAEENIMTSLKILEKQLGSQHPYFAEGLEVSARYYYGIGNRKDALDKSKTAFEIRAQNFNLAASVMSEKDALTYSNFMRRAANLYLSCFVGTPASLVNETEVAEVIFKVKGVVSDAIYERQREVGYKENGVTKKLWKEYRAITQQLSNLFVRGISTTSSTDLRVQLDSLNNLAHLLESQLTRASAGFKNKFEDRVITVEKLAELIPGNSVLVEYLKFDRLQPGTDSISPHYIVVILNRKAKVQVLDLGKASPIDALVENYRQHLAKISTQSYLPTSRETEVYKKIAKQLFEKIWQPLVKYTSQANLVFICPDGGLNLVSFAGLVDQEDRYLIEKRILQYLSSGRDLMRLQNPVKYNQGLLALGDPDYDAGQVFKPVGMGQEQKKGSPPSAGSSYNLRSGCDLFQHLKVDRLPGTGREVEQIVSQWKKSSSEPAEIYLGTEATEVNFRRRAPGKRVIHLATHGYFLQGVCDSDRAFTKWESWNNFLGENPLLLSGLLLAGVNWYRGNSTGQSESWDGVLTAQEVATMQLEGTQMIILSACETGLGEVKQGEGVYGLRRAFLMAGARTIISALWKVPDKITAETMEQLYRLGTKNIPQRLREVQLLQLTRLRQHGDSDHPFSWGAFIAQGDWR